MDDSREDDWAAVVNSFTQNRVPRMASMGIRVTELSELRAVGTAPLEGNSNHMRSMYAGTIFGLAEMVGGALPFPSFPADEFYPTVKNVDLTFRRPVRTDLTATVEWTPDQLAAIREELAVCTKSEYVVNVALTDADGRLVAQSVGTYQVRRNGN